ncbi:MAG: IS110 family transposase, partial [Candidatus Aegiribacteria sp.]|nr:IS110 family transposase [Candidatus Aegiribacteria sp.]
HQYYCGIDLHARVMYLCIISSDGEIVLHRNMKADPESLLKAIEPYRPDVVVGVECIFTWYWVADLCAEEGIPFVLGHALYMKAIHGGKAKNDRIDSGKIAAMLKGGMFPMAYVYPAKMRATRDLLRRRNYLVRKRADLITHVQNTNSQYNQPEFGMNITYKCNREEVLSHFKDPNVYMSMKVNLDLIDQFTVQIRAMEKHVLDNAKNHDPQSLYLMRTIYGIGKVLSLTILYEIGDISRFPRVQEFASYSRLVKCSRESAGKRYGTAGSKIGNVHLKWAFSEASVMFLKGNPEGMKYKKQLERKHGKAKSLSILAHKLGRAAYYMLKRNRAFDMNKFLSA